jgi:hypothetical protein
MLPAETRYRCAYWQAKAYKKDNQSVPIVPKKKTALGTVFGDTQTQYQQGFPPDLTFVPIVPKKKNAFGLRVC